MNSIIVIVIVTVVVALVCAFISTNKIRKNGIETEGEISRIEIERTPIEEPDSAIINYETTKNYFVKYKNENGDTIEASLINPKMSLQEGDIIKIKYLPEKQKNVLRVK